jgi:5-methylcytosine-specific restriction protein A
MNKKQFIEQEGATCQNWTWSWSYVNHEKKFVIFGAWLDIKNNDDFLILSEKWQINPDGKKTPGYNQSLDHINLILKDGYKLRIFVMEAEDVNSHPRKIKFFEQKLHDKYLLPRNNNGIREYYACDEFRSAEEVIAGTESYKEGLLTQVKVNKYERNPDARRKCIEKYGYNCWVCEFDFEKFYGSEIGSEYIHVHHKVLVSARGGEEYIINPEEDLIPVCPNCHSMIHRNPNKPIDVNELKNIIIKNKKN